MVSLADRWRQRRYLRVEISICDCWSQWNLSSLLDFFNAAAIGRRTLEMLGALLSRCLLLRTIFELRLKKVIMLLSSFKGRKGSRETKFFELEFLGSLDELCPRGEYDGKIIYLSPQIILREFPM